MYNMGKAELLAPVLKRPPLVETRVAEEDRRIVFDPGEHGGVTGIAVTALGSDDPQVRYVQVGE